jgi:hypothetical protein
MAARCAGLRFQLKRELHDERVSGEQSGRFRAASAPDFEASAVSCSFAGLSPPGKPPRKELAEPARIGTGESPGRPLEAFQDETHRSN